MQIYKLIFIIILYNQAFSLACILKQLQASGNGHDLSPFGHMSRGYVDDLAVLIPVMELKSKILKYGRSLYKGGIRKRNRVVPAFQKRAQYLKKTLHTGTYHNIIGGALNIPAMSYVVSQHLSEILLPLYFAVGQHSLILPQGTFDISAPKVETEAFSVYACRGEVKPDIYALAVPGTGLLALMNRDFSYIVSTLGFGKDVSVCSQLKISIFYGSSA